MSNYFIEKTWEGVRVQSPKLTGETKTTFRCALMSFSYLINNGEKITVDDFRWRIARHCHPSDRVVNILQTLDRVTATP